METSEEYKKWEINEETLILLRKHENELVTLNNKISRQNSRIYVLNNIQIKEIFRNDKGAITVQFMKESD